MLPAALRLTTRRDFSETFRRGPRSVRVADRALVVHARLVEEISAGSRVGFVVPKAVGPAVVRNKVRRRLRAIARERWDEMPAGNVVVRVLPPARDCTYELLSSSLAAALAEVRRRGRRA